MPSSHIPRNRLTALFNWNGKKTNLIFQDDKFSSDIVNVSVERIPVLKCGNRCLFRNAKTNTITAVVGYISNLDQICIKYHIDKNDDVEIIEKIYALNGIKFISELEGVFTILIWDEAKQKGYVFQDEYGSNLPLYYASNCKELCISTSIRAILNRDLFSRKLNMSAVGDFFISKVIVPNKDTFIEGVFKLVPHHCIVIDGEMTSFQIKPVQYSKKKVSLHYAKANLIESLSNSIQVLHEQLKSDRRICTLSAGLDSNAILNYLSRLTKRIVAITIGGKKRNEIPNAVKLAEHYANVEHITAIVNDNRLDYFPDIVWRTEGYVCEGGLFLQYELANLLSTHGLTELMCGEGANEILDPLRNQESYFYLKREFKSYLRYIVLHENWPGRIRESKLFQYIRKPTLKIHYDYELDYTLKKNGILMNSYGIQPVYPFVNRRIAEMSAALGELNKRVIKRGVMQERNFYRQQIQTVLGKSKMALIIEAGGATDVEYLFEGYHETISALMEHSFFRPVIRKKRINRIRKDLKGHSELVLRLLYLFVFNKLFISGEFDSKFQDMELKINLKDILQDELFKMNGQVK